MNEEVSDSNIYSRLVALEKMEVVKDYRIIRQKSVAIVGVGGIGSVVAEMLTRCGIGKLILFDYDRVELANMNRLFFTPEQANRKLFKTDAARETLTSINPDVNIATYCYDITTSSNFEKLLNTLKTEGDPKKENPVQQQIDLLLCCVDNHAARMSINLACLELGLAWIESGVSETAMSGHIQFIQPGISPCFECAPPLLIAEGLDEKSIKRKYACAASLPTTMAIVAGLMGNNVLEYLLNFGQIVDYCGYNVLSSHFVKQDMKVSLDCPNSKCQARQAEWRAFLERQKVASSSSSGGGGGDSKKAKEVEEKKKEKEAEMEKWKKMGIVLEDESDNTDEEAATGLELGLRYQFAKEMVTKEKEKSEAAIPTPTFSVLTSTSSASSSSSSSSSLSPADLLSQLKGLHGNK